MRDIDQTLRTLGFAARQRQLYEFGHSKAQIAKAVADGTLLRLNRAWLAHPEVNPSIVTAIRAGGVLGGASALRSYKIWVTEPPSDVVVATLPWQPVGAEEGVQRLWRRFTTDAPHEWRVTVADALQQYLPQARRLDGIATLDSALHNRMLTPAELPELQGRLPARCRHWFRQLDSRCEAGTESIVRVAASDRGWIVEPQVPFDEGRLDLVIDGWLCVECDSREWHSSAEQTSRDHQRTQRILAAGGRPIRLKYADVVHNLDNTMDGLARVLAAGHPTRLGHPQAAVSVSAARRF